MDLEIECTRCKSKVEHVCSQDFKMAAMHLLNIKLGHFGMAHDTIVKKEGSYYQEGDENAPFYSEAYLYSLLGKEDARTILYSLQNLIRADGLDPNELQHVSQDDLEDLERKQRIKTGLKRAEARVEEFKKALGK